MPNNKKILFNRKQNSILISSPTEQNQWFGFEFGKNEFDKWTTFYEYNPLTKEIIPYDIHYYFEDDVFLPCVFENVPVNEYNKPIEYLVKNTTYDL
jgi:hypothetical protein